MNEANNDFDRFFQGMLEAAAKVMKPFLETMQEHDLLLQPHPQQPAFVAIGPRLTDEEQTELRETLTGTPLQGIPIYFVLGPKKSTLDGIMSTLNEASQYHQSRIGMVPPEGGDQPEELRIDLLGKEPVDETWSKIHGILAKDSFIKRWSVRVNGDIKFESSEIQHETSNKASKTVIEPKSPKPLREKVIQDDDITDVKISLGKANTVEDFIQEMFPGGDENEKDLEK